MVDAKKSRLERMPINWAAVATIVGTILGGVTAIAAFGLYLLTIHLEPINILVKLHEEAIKNQSVRIETIERRIGNNENRIDRIERQRQVDAAPGQAKQ